MKEQIPGQPVPKINRLLRHPAPSSFATICVETKAKTCAAATGFSETAGWPKAGLMPRNAHPELREAATLSQEELAHRARLDRSDMSGIEGGVRNPPS